MEGGAVGFGAEMEDTGRQLGEHDYPATLISRAVGKTLQAGRGEGRVQNEGFPNPQIFNPVRRPLPSRASPSTFTQMSLYTFRGWHLLP